MADKQVKIFRSGGLNTDSAIEDIQANDFIDALNVRVTGTDESEAGYVTNIESTRKLTPSLQRPVGINKTVGFVGFKNNKKVVSIYYNSQGKHQITVLNQETLVETVIFEDLTDTAGVNVFDITPNTYFSDLKLINEQFLVTTNGESGIIYCIDLVKLESGGYGNNIKQDEFNLLKKQPLVPIKASYANDPNIKSNLLKGKLFQFRYSYTYFDGMSSAWSTISKRPTPIEELTDSVGDDPSKLNVITLNLNAGDSLVKEINIAVRVGDYDWYKVKTVKRADIIALPQAGFSYEDELTEVYYTDTNSYEFGFYNDVVREAITPLDTDEPYDAIPRNAGALEVVNGNIIVLGDLQEGYPRPTVKASTTVTNYKANINAGILDEVRNFTAYISEQKRISGSHKRYIAIYFKNNPKTGDIIKITTANTNTNAVMNTYEYEAVVGDNYNLESFVVGLKNKLPNRSVSGFNKNHTAYSSDEVLLGFVGDDYEEVSKIELIFTGSGASAEGSTLNVLKDGSSYQLALAHYDKFGRSFPIVTDDRFVVNTTSFAISKGLSPQIGWTIDDTPPKDAVSYQWLLSENTKYRRTLYVTGVYDPDESNGDFISFNLKSLGEYIKQDKANNVAYDFTEGDRVSLIRTFTQATPDIKWFNSPPLDFAVSSYEIKVNTAVTPNTTKYLLKIKKSNLINIATDLVSKEIVLELYTPKKNNDSLESKVFYEIGEQFPIVNGEYSSKSGGITAGDTYIRPRKYISNIVPNVVFPITVEDFNFSDDYDSNFWSKGRGRTYNDEVGEVHRKGCFRFSDPFNLGSLNNNMNRFYQSRIYGDQPSETTSLNGAIAKMVLRGQYLIVLQELAVAHVPVFTSILEDQAEQQNVAISSKLFNNVRYITTSLGAGKAKRAITLSSNDTVYFIDPNNGYPCRDGFDGVKVINYNNEKYFVEAIKNADPRTFISYFDDYNQEWNLTFSNLNSQVEAFVFREFNYEYKDTYTQTVDDVTIVQPTNGTVVKFGANLKYTPNNNYIGGDSFTVSFLDGSNTIVKKACINVKFGNTQIQPFTFSPVTGTPLSSWVESNSNTLIGATVGVPISVVNGQYSINGGAWTATAGTILPNKTFKIRVMSSASNITATSGTLTISNVSATFSVTTLSVGQTFKNIRLTATRQKNNCGVDTVGTSVTLVVEAENPAYNSTVSQADANSKAQAYLDANAQTYANTNGTCTPLALQSNSRQSKTFFKECTLPSVGTAYEEVREAGTVFGSTRAIANALALVQIDATGQANANTFGTCNVPNYFTFKLVFQSNYDKASILSSDYRGRSFEFTNDSLYSNVFSKITVPISVVGDNLEYTYTVPFFGSTVDLNSVNAFLTLIANTSTEANFNAKLFLDGTLIGSNTVTRPIGSINKAYTNRTTTTELKTLTTSSVLKLVLGTAPAPITYYSAENYSGFAIKDDCGGTATGGGTVLSTAVGQFTSVISQLDADNQAQAYIDANKQAYANANGTCTWYSVVKSKTAVKNDCGENQAGTEVTLSSTNGQFTSEASQLDADNQAQLWANQNAQNNANANGSCNFVCDMVVTTSYTKDEAPYDNLYRVIVTTNKTGILEFSKDNGTTWATGFSPYTFYQVDGSVTIPISVQYLGGNCRVNKNVNIPI